MMKKFSILMQFVSFLRESKKYWLIPIILVFALVGLMLVAAHGSVVAPFIYTLI